MRGRPLEPDADNAVVGNGKANRVPQGCGFFIFMRLTVNGESLETVNTETILELLHELKIDSGRVAAVEVNLSIIRKVDFPDFRLKDGDRVEIVNFVGGG